MNKVSFKFTPSKVKSSDRFGIKPSKDQLNECTRIAEENNQFLDDRAALIFLLALFILLQSCFSVANYSGHQSPPMFGDFEAQRHWMEVTVNLSPSEWYVNSTTNDLNYWGLDYPPLTAYHSWLLGQIALSVDPNWVRLGHSRGLEEPRLKLFMRFSVIFTMVALFAPALIHLLLGQQRTEEVKGNKKGIVMANPTKVLRLVGAPLLFPGLLFVDCAHFQYNHCSLGLFLWALFFLEKGRLRAGAFFFVLALNHKQMELYHALPIAVFLFARSFVHTNRIRSLFSAIGQSAFNLFQLALVVLLTFAILWFPFLWPDPSLALQLLRRIFPFHRGLFEDKVANFWCCASVLVKFKQIFSINVLVKASAFLVFFACVPSLFCLFYRPNSSNLRVALTANALAFFLFSFQVHEKSVLLAAIPALLLLNDESLQRPTSLFLVASLFSLFPLCLKDGVAEVLPLFLAYSFLLWLQFFRFSNGRPFPSLYNFLFCFVLGPSFAICVFQLLLSPPVRFLHLFPLLNALFSFGIFTIFWLHLNFVIVRQNLAVFTEQRNREAVKKNSAKRKQQ
ncbi:hypothetical protein niasHS_006822 [Heterodera schachtii]|uniref:Alpha-1,3-glucosyltransferase n=1 Tax=Heterodera schachtii TaxID=97005 RepID=A0ABD2JIH4_HETSC